MSDTKMKEDARKVIFAAVGAPVLVGKTVSEKLSNRFSDANAKAGNFRERFLKDARTEFEKWAAEGESLVKKLQERGPLEDLSQRVDVDQFQQQVGKLRTQLEDIIESWRSNFTPDSERATKVTIEVDQAKTATKAAPAVKKPATKAATKPTAKKPAAKKPVASTKATKAKATTPKATTAAKKPAAKATTKPAAKKAPAPKKTA